MGVYEKLRQALFEVFLAGYQQGYCKAPNIADAFEDWWKESVGD
jgi:hypothetical protein